MESSAGKQWTTGPQLVARAYSDLAAAPSIVAAELRELTACDGALLYYPPAIGVEIGGGL